MSLDLRYLPEVVRDREKLDRDQWKEIEEKILKVAEEGLNNPYTKLVPRPDLSNPVWELKVEDENTDHRVFLDVDSGKLLVLAVWGFDFTHSGEKHWEKLENRMKDK